MTEGTGHPEQRLPSVPAPAPRASRRLAPFSPSCPAPAACPGPGGRPTAGSPAGEAGRSLFPAGGRATMAGRKEAGRRQGRDTGRRAWRREGKGRGTVGRGDGSKRRAWRGRSCPAGTGTGPRPGPALSGDPPRAPSNTSRLARSGQRRSPTRLSPVFHSAGSWSPRCRNPSVLFFVPVTGFKS